MIRAHSDAQCNRAGQSNTKAMQEPSMSNHRSKTELLSVQIADDF